MEGRLGATKAVLQLPKTAQITPQQGGK